MIRRLSAAAFGPQFWLTGYAFLALGLLLPGDWSWLKPVVPVLLGGILFFSFLRLPLTEVTQALSHRGRWIATGWMALLKLILIPLAVWGLMRVIAPAWANGMLLVACMPAGLSAIALTDLVRGDRAQALMLVIITSVLAPLTIPGLLTLLSGAQADPSLVAGRALYILALIAIPFAVAQFVRTALPKIVARHAAHWGQAAIACSMTLIGVSVLAVRQAWVGTPLVSLLWPLLLTILVSLVALAASYLVLQRTTRGQAVAFACAAIYLNNGLAVAFAVRFYPGVAEMVLPAILIQVPMLAMIAWLRTTNERSQARAE